MNPNRKNAKIAGILFLTAMVSSLMGGGIIEFVFADHEFPGNLNSNSFLLSTGIILELINAVSVLGIVLLLYPILKTHNQGISVGFAGLRIIESILCFTGGILPLFIMSTGQGSVAAGPSEAGIYETLMTVIISIRAGLAGIWIPLFFSLGALLFYFLIYKSRLLPRFIPIWGFLGAILILMLNFLNMEMGAGMMVLALPMILNEIFLGIWLIVKGFNEEKQTV